MSDHASSNQSACGIVGTDDRTRCRTVFDTPIRVDMTDQYPVAELPRIRIPEVGVFNLTRQMVYP